MTPKHFLQLRDFTREEFEYLFRRTRWIKDRFKRYELYQPLRDRTLAMVFEKASTRTRVSFEAGMNQLGGIAIKAALERAGTPVESVHTDAAVTLRLVDGVPTITKIALTTQGRVPGIDEATFVKEAEAAKVGCVVSRALAGVPEITLEASLL